VRRLEIDLGAPGAGHLAVDLARAALFVPELDGVVDTEWEIVFLGGDTPVGVIARVVFADETGVGLQMAMGQVVRDRLAAIAERAPVLEPGVASEPVWVVHDEPELGSEPEPEPGSDLDDAAVDDHARSIPRNVYERMRGLTMVQQHKVAREGELHERMALERIYGKTVWEVLLRNSRITAPEVARIARKGNLPRPQIEHIVGNGAWLAIPEIRRALLGNPRLSAELIPRVLRHLPKAELKLATTQLAYPAIVRDAARRMLKGGGSRDP
jgi:hypothetical protein